MFCPSNCAGNGVCIWGRNPPKCNCFSDKEEPNCNSYMVKENTKDKPPPDYMLDDDFRYNGAPSKTKQKSLPTRAPSLPPVNIEKNISKSQELQFNTVSFISIVILLIHFVV